MGVRISRSVGAGRESEDFPDHFLECLSSSVKNQVLARRGNFGPIDSSFYGPAAHKFSITCLGCFGPDEDIVVTGSEDRTIRIWDFSDKQRLAEHWRAHGLGAPDCIYAAAEPAGGQPPYAALGCPLARHPADAHQRWVTCVAMDWACALVYR